MVCRYFLLSFRLSFLHGILPDVKVFNFGEVQFIIFFIITCAFGAVSKTALPNSRSGRFIPVFSSKSFIVLGLNCGL